MNSGQQVALFIGGVGRSGTTLIVDMLGLHHSLSPVYETDFVLPFLEWVRNKNVEQLKNAIIFSIKWAEPLPYRPHSKREHEKYHHGPHYILFTKKHMEEKISVFLEDLNASNILQKINRLIHELFRCHSEADKKELWINKTPAYVVYLPELKQVFPKMKFIHLVRDGRDVACSAVTRPWGPNTHLDAANWWKSQIIGTRKFANVYPDDYLEVRYEDLLLDTEPILKRIFSFLQVQDESSTLVEIYTEGRNGISLTKSPIGNWKTRFDDEEKAKFWDLAGDLLSDLGYSR